MTYSLSRNWLPLIVACVLVSTSINEGYAQRDQEFREQGAEMFRRMSGADNLRNSREILSIFRTVSEPAAESTVQLLDEDKPIALATIVSSDGYMITKASELTPGFRCRLSDGSHVEPSIIGVDTGEDIALLKIDAADLVPVEFNSEKSPIVGHWLVSIGPTPLPLGIGVVSVAERPIRRGFMGVLLENAPDDSGAVIRQLVPGAPAEMAGFEVGDVVIKVGDDVVTSRPSLQALIGRRSAGEVVQITVLRENMEREMVIDLELGNRAEIAGPSSSNEEQNELGGQPNEVNEGFLLAIQHDSGIQFDQCGGPVVDLDGEVIGINIARAGRVKCYATPASIILPILEKLKTGEYSMAVAYEDRLSELNDQIAEYEKERSEYENQKSEASTDIEGLEAMVATIEQQQADGEIEAEDASRMIEDLEDKMLDAEKKIRIANSRVNRMNRRINSLSEERDFLAGE